LKVIGRSRIERQEEEEEEEGLAVENRVMLIRQLDGRLQTSRFLSLLTFQVVVGVVEVEAEAVPRIHRQEAVEVEVEAEQAVMTAVRIPNLIANRSNPLHSILIKVGRQHKHRSSRAQHTH
jgi:hypothetical protein